MSAHLKTRGQDLCLAPKIITLGELMTKSTDWTNWVDNTAPVEALFGSALPGLDAIELHEIILHRDGPRVVLRFDLKDFPVLPPKKWSAAGFNRLQMRLLASGVQDLQIVGLLPQMKVDLSINKDGPLIYLCAENGAVRLELRADFVIVDSISAYCEKSLN
jgi:hypothetical protein